MDSRSRRRESYLDIAGRDIELANMNANVLRDRSVQCFSRFGIRHLWCGAMKWRRMRKYHIVHVKLSLAPDQHVVLSSS
ncbi:unnamed protein product [Parnassius mnemosyne]|uniref:Uncharacterized protein n=1 Tax=Parnassius mnemosyne TaxID=213953 RepID=A0AAV1K8I4_9NEOP